MAEDTQLELVTPTALTSAHIKLSQYGITFEGTPTIEEWRQVAQAIEQGQAMMQFYLGDLIVFAESPVTGWGESKYEQLLQDTGLDYGTLRHYASVARKFPLEFREEICVLKDTSSKPITYTHFREVMGLELPQAKYFLEMCKKGNWSVAKLRENVIRLKNNGELPEPRQPEQLPDGWVPFRELPKGAIKGYVPAPQNLDRNDFNTKRGLLEVEQWEMEKLIMDYKDDPHMESFVERVEILLEA